MANTTIYLHLFCGNDLSFTNLIVLIMKREAFVIITYIIQDSRCYVRRPKHAFYDAPPLGRRVAVKVKAVVSYSVLHPYEALR